MLPLMVHTEDGAYTQGEVFSKAFTEDEESANLDSGLLDLVPRSNKVVGTSRVFDTEPGETFEGCLRIGPEAMLIEGGHIEPVKARTQRRVATAANLKQP